MGELFPGASNPSELTVVHPQDVDTFSTLSGFDVTFLMKTCLLTTAPSATRPKSTSDGVATIGEAVKRSTLATPA